MRLSRRAKASTAVLVLAAAAFAAGSAVAQTRGNIESSPLLPPGSVGTPGQQPPSFPQQPPRGAPRPQGQPLPPPPASAPPVQAQPAPVAPAQPAQPDPDADATIVPPPSQKIANPYAVFAGLDKITGRITSFDVAIGETVQFGALQVTPRVCYTRPPTELQNTTAFAEVNEVTLKGEAKRIFTGWMFASSPGLHGVEHPIYDVWLTNCRASAPGTGASRGQQ